MDILIDSNAFIWFVTDDRHLSDLGMGYIQDPNNLIFISIASLWELGIKYSLGKLESQLSGFNIVFEQIESNGFEILPISTEHIQVITSLPMHHRDPFDRIIIAQSLTENIPLISSDSKFDDYGVVRLWK